MSITKKVDQRVPKQASGIDITIISYLQYVSIDNITLRIVDVELKQQNTLDFFFLMYR